MFLRTKLTIAGMILGLAAGGAAAVAQQPRVSPDSGTPQPRVMARNAMRQRALAGIFRVLRQLNLTDTQKQQAQVIVKAAAQSTKPQRQELRPLIRQWRTGTLTTDGLTRANELHKQLIDARKSVRTQLVAILTPEQKAKLEEIIKTRKANHGFFKPND